MSETGDVTRWIKGLKSGDQESARQLWEQYFQKLIRLVELKLPAKAKRAFDGEDVALSALNSLFRGAAEERFPDLNDRGNLWAILTVVATRKAHTYVEAHSRQKRGGGKVRGHSVFLSDQDNMESAGFDGLPGDEPTPELVLRAREECDQLLDRLGDDVLKQIAILKMQGYLVVEIAQRLGCTKRSVQRRLEIIRKTWRESLRQEGVDS